MKKCDRCGKDNELSILSMFNEEHICLECKDRETAHPKYAEAEAAQKASEARGERFYKGIGCPPDLYDKA